MRTLRNRKRYVYSIHCIRYFIIWEATIFYYIDKRGEDLRIVVAGTPRCIPGIAGNPITRFLLRKPQRISLYEGSSRLKKKNHLNRDRQTLLHIILYYLYIPTLYYYKMHISFEYDIIQS